MKRSSNTIFTNLLLLGAALSLSACEGIFESIYDTPIQSEMTITEGSFTQVKTTEYTQWVYIDLSNGKATTVGIGDGQESQIPDNWDFAIHRYDIQTNEGAAFKTSYTSLDDLEATGKLPEASAFTTDEWTTDKIAIDMSGMMDGNIIYTEAYRNPVLSDWLDVNTATMPPVYTMSKQVYIIRLKNGSHAAIQFTNYMNAAGTKGYIDFNYIYPLALGSDAPANDETNDKEE